MNIPPFVADLAERAGWTALQAALGLVTVESLHVPTGYAVLVATALAGVKGWVGKHVTGTAALAPHAAAAGKHEAPTP